MKKKVLLTGILSIIVSLTVGCTNGKENTTLEVIPNEGVSKEYKEGIEEHERLVNNMYEYLQSKTPRAEVIENTDENQLYTGVGEVSFLGENRSVYVIDAGVKGHYFNYKSDINEEKSTYTVEYTIKLSREAEDAKLLEIKDVYKVLTNENLSDDEELYNSLNRGLNIEPVGVSLYKKEYGDTVIDIIKVDNTSISINMTKTII